VIEQGTHAELTSIAGGLYRRLWAKQTGFLLSDDGFPGWRFTGKIKTQINEFYVHIHR